MSKFGRMSKFVTLPQDWINETLILLPVKSLMRFKAVSKSFCSVIENLHLKRNQISGKLIELQVHKSGEEIHALEFGDDYLRETVLVKPMSTEQLNMGYSYCNGLVLLHMLPGKLLLWNPSTQEYRELPGLPLECPRDPELSFGLGYDPNTDDYKAVVITPVKGWDSQVFMFELRSSCWKTIRDGDNKYFPFMAFSGGNRDGFVDGALYFACVRELEEQCMIVSFDVAKETFSEVENSADCQHIRDDYIQLNVIGGSLAMSIFYNSEGEREIDRVDTYIQKMEGNELTWTGLYNATEERFGQEVFGCFSRGKHTYSSEGDKVFFAANGKLFSYDYKKEHLQETEVEMKDNHFNLLFCIENLVSLNPYSRIYK